MDDFVNPYLSPGHSPRPGDDAQGTAQEDPLGSARVWGMAACLGIAANVVLALGSVAISLAILWIYKVENVEQIDPLHEQTLLFWLNVDFLAMLAARLLTAIPFLVWMYKVYLNLLALGHDSLEWKPWMAPLCWVIPLFNFIAPCLVMREIVWKSDVRAEELGRNNPSLQTVNLWWGAWIAGIVLSWIGNQLDLAASSLADHVLATRCDVATSAVVIVCGILAMRIVRLVNHLQSRRYSALLQQPPQESPEDITYRSK